MLKKRRIEIITKTERVFVHAQQQQRIGQFVWCARCAAPACMMKPEQASALIGVKTRLLYQWIEAGTIHFTETPDGLLLLCFDSLSKNAAHFSNGSDEP
jgi:hypothetical protein